MVGDRSRGHSYPEESDLQIWGFKSVIESFGLIWTRVCLLKFFAAFFIRKHVTRYVSGIDLEFSGSFLISKNDLFLRICRGFDLLLRICKGFFMLTFFNLDRKGQFWERFLSFLVFRDLFLSRQH